jgi:hypothetical protein
MKMYAVKNCKTGAVYVAWGISEDAIKQLLSGEFASDEFKVVCLSDLYETDQMPQLIFS